MLLSHSFALPGPSSWQRASPATLPRGPRRCGGRGEVPPSLWGTPGCVWACVWAHAWHSWHGAGQRCAVSPAALGVSQAAPQYPALLVAAHPCCCSERSLYPQRWWHPNVLPDNPQQGSQQRDLPRAGSRVAEGTVMLAGCMA